jgi:hypothetical protein
MAETNRSFAVGADAGADHRRRSRAECGNGCASPQSYVGLAPGSHVFEIRATDASGNVEGSPASYDWTVA